MAIDLYKLNEYLTDLKSAYEESVNSNKSADELNKILTQINHIENLIEERMGQMEKNNDD